MKSINIASLLIISSIAGSFGSSATAAEANADARFAGHWVEINGPTPPRVFETEVAGGRLKLIISEEMAPPRGRMLFLERVGPDVFKTAPESDVTAQFSLTGPGKAHLDLRTFSIKWTSVTSTDLVRR